MYLGTAGFRYHPAMDRSEPRSNVPPAPVRVVMSSPTWSLNGVNVFSERLARGSRARGVDAAIAITRPDRADPKPLPRPDPRDLLVEFRPRVAFTWGARARAFARFLADGEAFAIRDGAAGLATGTTIHLPNYDYEHSVASALLPPEVVVVGIVHSDDPEHYDHLRRLGRYWNGVVAVSRAIADRILAEGLAPAGRLRTIPYGVECDDAPAERTRRDEKGDAGAPGARRPLRAIYAGRIARAQKRAFDLIAIEREMRARGVAFELTVAGGGPDEAAFREAAREPIAEGTIRMAGILDAGALAKAYRASDVFLLVSEFEGLPIAMLEAMGRGCAPLASAIASGVPEVVRDGANGLLAPVGDVAAFADRLARLAGDAEELERLRRAAHASVRSGPFGVEAMTDSYLAFFAELAAEARAGGFARPSPGAFPPPGSLPAMWRYLVPEPMRPASDRLARLLRRPRASSGAGRATR